MRDVRVRAALLTIALAPGVNLWAQEASGDACSLLKSELSEDLKTGPPIEEQPLPPPDCHLDRGCLIVDWRIASPQDINGSLSRYRFTPKKPLRIVTVNVNRILYVVTWTHSVEPPNKAFESISGLWDKVFPLLGFLGLPSPAGIPSANADSPLVKWVRALEFSDLCLSRTLASNTSLVIDADTGDPTKNRRRIDFVARLMTAALPALEKRRLVFLGQATDTSQYDTYWKIAQRHSDFVRRATEFLPLAKEAVTGTETTISVKQRNAVVDIAGQAAKRSGEVVGPAVAARYFVANERPLIYHIGYGQGRIRDFDFEKVRTASGQDLFSWIKPEDKTTVAEADGASLEPLAFMSWEFKTWGPNDRYGTAVTIGTGLNTPGESLYYGGTFRIFSRVLISGGLVSAGATRGDDAVAETLPDGGMRELFASLGRKGSTDPFWSISFKVY